MIGSGLGWCFYRSVSVQNFARAYDYENYAQWRVIYGKEKLSLLSIMRDNHLICVGGITVEVFLVSWSLMKNLLNQK